jgi:hypothetical protein
MHTTEAATVRRSVHVGIRPPPPRTPAYITDLDELASAFDEPARRMLLVDNVRTLFGRDR